MTDWTILFVLLQVVSCLSLSTAVILCLSIPVLASISPARDTCKLEFISRMLMETVDSTIARSATTATFSAGGMAVDVSELING